MKLQTLKDLYAHELKALYSAERQILDEIAGYGSALAYAEMLGDTEGARLLQTTLNEETETDRKLAELAKSVINLIANK